MTKKNQIAALLATYAIAMIGCYHSTPPPERTASHANASTICPDTKEKEESNRYILDPEVPLPLGAIDPDSSIYLGLGYNIFTGEPRGRCINGGDVYRTVGTASFNSTYSEIDNKYELKKKLSSTAITSGTGSVYGVSIVASTEKTIFENTEITNNTITILGNLTYTDSSVYRITSTMTQDSQDLLKSDKNRFINQYGHAYIKSADIGENLYLVYQVKIDNSKTIDRTTLKKSVDIKYKDFVGIKVTQDSLQEAELNLVGSSIQTRVYATGGFIPGLLSTKDDFRRISSEFQQFVKDKQNNAARNYSILNKTLGTYDDIISDNNASLRLYTLATYHNAWCQEEEKIGLIRSNTSPGTALYNKCNIALSTIYKEKALIGALDSNSRMPASDEFSDIYPDYYQTISLPVSRASVRNPTPGIRTPSDRIWNLPYHYSLIGSDRDIINTINDINSKLSPVRSRYEFDGTHGKLITRNEAGTVGIYALLHPNNTTVFMTTNTNERLSYISKGFKETNNGNPIGFIFTEPAPFLIPLFQVTGDCTLTPIGKTPMVHNDYSYAITTNQTEVDSLLSGNSYIYPTWFLTFRTPINAEMKTKFRDQKLLGYILK